MAGETIMKTAIFALALAASFGAATIPAFAESNAMDRSDSANSLPPGFYNNTPFGIHAQIVEQHFANEGESSWLVKRGVIPPVPPQAQAQAQPAPRG
jgi:hypothetical protein